MGATKDLFISIQDELVNSIDKYENGEVSALETLLYLRGFKNKAEEVLSVVKDFENQNIEQIENEAKQFGNFYNGFEIKKVNGRTSYVYKNIPEVLALDNQKKSIEQKYKSAFDGYQKGIVQTTEDNGELKWIDENGELKPFPELSHSASYIMVKQSKNGIQS